MTKVLRFILPAMVLGVFSMPASAQEQWKQTLVPFYLWAAGIEGQSQIGPIDAPVSLEFSDALEHLDTSVTVRYEATKGQWGVLADVYHLVLKPEATLPNGVLAGIDLTNTIYELGGIYKPGSQGLDVLFGLRAMNLNMEGGLGVNSKRTLIDENWLDAFAGVRKNFAISEKASFSVRGDIGTGDSNFVWNAALLFNYKFNKTVSMFGGYRWLDYDYDQGTGADRFVYDVTYQGPAIALRFDW